MEGMEGDGGHMPRASQGRRGPKRASEDPRATIEVLYSGIVTFRAPKRSLRGADRAIIGL